MSSDNQQSPHQLEYLTPLPRRATDWGFVRGLVALAVLLNALYCGFGALIELCQACASNTWRFAADHLLNAGQFAFGAIVCGILLVACLEKPAAPKE